MKRQASPRTGALKNLGLIAVVLTPVSGRHIFERSLDHVSRGEITSLPFPALGSGVLKCNLERHQDKPCCQSGLSDTSPRMTK